MSARISCPDYEPSAGSRRCSSFIEGGTCVRADRFLCTEWERANAHLLGSSGAVQLRLIQGGKHDTAREARRG